MSQVDVSGILVPVGPGVHIRGLSLEEPAFSVPGQDLIICIHVCVAFDRQPLQVLSWARNIVLWIEVFAKCFFVLYVRELFDSFVALTFALRPGDLFL